MLPAVSDPSTARRGVSPAAAALLLIVIAVTAALLAYTWIASLVGAGPETPPLHLQELLKIEALEQKNSKLRITVKNIGVLEAEVQRVYLIDERGLAAASYAVDPPLRLRPGKEKTLEVEARVAAGTFTLKIVTTRGIEASYRLRVQGGQRPPAPIAGTLVVAVEPPQGGVTDPPSGTYSYPLGAAVVVAARPSPGYRFVAWLLNGSRYSSEETTTVQVTGYITLTATFQAAPLFQVANKTLTASGPPSSQAEIAILVRNEGAAWGGFSVEVYDQNQQLAGSTQGSAQPGETATVKLQVLLPGAPGAYLWEVKVLNLLTGAYDDCRGMTVVAYSETGQPSFQIAEYNPQVYGTSSESTTLSFTLVNTGGAPGHAELQLYNHNNQLLTWQQVALQPGETITVPLQAQLPPSPGTYTWAAKVYNLDTGSYDDEKTITVTVLSELIRNSDFSQGSAYWNLENPWYVDTSLQLARAHTRTNEDFSASISQTFEAPGAVTLTQLQLYYYMYASPPGQVDMLQLRIAIENSTTTLWSDSTSWSQSTNPASGTYTAPLSLHLTPVTYRLRIAAIVDVKRGGLSELDVRVDNVSLLATPP